MDTLTVENTTNKTRQIMRIIVGLYLTIFCGYFMFSEAAIGKYGTLFYTAVLGTLLALFLVLSNSIWAMNRILLTIDSITIDSKIPHNKFKVNWINVSNVTVGEGCISFFVDGGRKERKLDLSTLQFKEIQPIKEKVVGLCTHKNIACNS